MTNLQDGADHHAAQVQQRLLLGLPIGVGALLALVLVGVGVLPQWLKLQSDSERLAQLEEIQGRIGGLPQAASGGTLLAAALSKVHQQVLHLGTTDPFVVVLSDGIPSDDDDPKARVDEMECDGINVLGLGLGPGSEKLAHFITHCQTHLHPRDISGAFTRILFQASRTSIQNFDRGSQVAT